MNKIQNIQKLKGKPHKKKSSRPKKCSQQPNHMIGTKMKNEDQ